MFVQWQPTSLAADSHDQGQRSLQNSGKVVWSSLRSLRACTFSLGDPATCGMLFMACCRLSQEHDDKWWKERLVDALPTEPWGPGYLHQSLFLFADLYKDGFKQLCILEYIIPSLV